MNFVDYLFDGAPLDDTPAVFSPQERLSRRDLAERVDALAAILAATTGAPGRRIGLMAGNSAFFIAAYLGILKSGNVAVLLDRALEPETAGQLLRRADVRLALLESGRAGRLAGRLRSLGIEVAGEADLADPPPGARTAPCDPSGQDHPAVILFTSGTSGDRKGVVLSHGNLIANTGAIIAALGLTAADRSCVVLPFHYCYGASVLHTHLRIGGSLYLGNTVFVGTLVREMDAFGCTNLAGVPTTFAMLAGHRAFWDSPPRALRLLTQAGGRMSPALAQRFRKELPGVGLAIMYGQTEATARLTVLSPDQAARKGGTVGRPIPGVEIVARDADGRALGPDEVGELAVRGPNVMLGYLDDPEATARKVRDGWLLTGDLGSVDADGFVTIAGRRSDVVKSRGHRLNPVQVEDVLSAYPGVRSCAVVGVEDPDWGEALAAFVVWEGAPLPDDHLRRLCRDRLPSYMQPKYLKTVTDLPLTASAKVDRAAVREMAAHAFGAAAGALPTETVPSRA